MKKHYKNEWHLCLVTHIFTKLSLNVCLINTHSLIYWYACCNCKLWNALWLYCFFLGIFINYWRLFISKLLYLHQTFTDCVSNQYTYVNILSCQMWMQVMVLFPFFGNFWYNNYRIFMSVVFYLHQTFTDRVSNQYTHSDTCSCYI